MSANNTSISTILLWCVLALLLIAPPCLADVHELPVKQTDIGEKVMLTPVGKEAFSVKVLTIKEHPVSSEVVVPGRIEISPDRTFRIHSLQEGRICRILAKLGQDVRQGQVLAWLDSAEINRLASETLQRRAEIEAELAQTKTMLDDEVNQVESKFTLARAAFGRIKQLFDEKIVARKDFEQALSEFEIASTRLSAAKRKREQVIAALIEKLHLTIEPLKQRLALLGLGQTGIEALLRTKKTVVCVPILSSHYGTVLAIKTTVGQSVSLADQLFTVADQKRVWIKGQVFESDVARINEGQEVSVRVPSVPGTVFKGRISYIAAEIDPEARTLPVAVEVANDRGLLKSGMYADVHILANESRMRPVIPADAILVRNGQRYVLVRKTGAFEPRNVKFGHAFDNLVEITQGIEAGDQVVVEGAFQLEGALLASGAKTISIDSKETETIKKVVQTNSGVELLGGWLGIALGSGIFSLGLVAGLLLGKESTIRSGTTGKAHIKRSVDEKAIQSSEVKTW